MLGPMSCEARESLRLHANGEEDEGEAGVVEAFLDGEDGVVMEPAGGEGILRENKLAAEENTVGEFRDDLRSDPIQFFHDIGAERVEGFGIMAMLAHIIDVVFEFVEHVTAEMVDFVGTLEVTRSEEHTS